MRMSFSIVENRISWKSFFERTFEMWLLTGWPIDRVFIMVFIRVYKKGKNVLEYFIDAD